MHFRGSRGPDYGVFLNTLIRMTAEFDCLCMVQISTIWHEMFFSPIFLESVTSKTDIWSVYSSLSSSFDVLATKEPKSAAILDFGHFRGSRGLYDNFFGIYDSKNMRIDTSLDVLCRFTNISISASILAAILFLGPWHQNRIVHQRFSHSRDQNEGVNLHHKRANGT